MQIPSRDIPQADILGDVVRAVEAVNSGFTTYQGIANYIEKVERQGRYYRRAAEIIGLISTNLNHSVLTNFGDQFINSPEVNRESLLKQAILNTQLFQRMITYFEMHPEGVTQTEIQGFMYEVTQPDVGASILPRRVSTVIRWLESIGILQERFDNRYMLNQQVINNIPILNFDNIEPLIPQTSELTEYEEVEVRLRNAGSEILVMRDQAALERAEAAHTQLVNIVAERVRQSGNLPRCNQLIDLATRINNEPYIFEMKSLTPDNARSQIRRGLSQLYEYRYLQNLPNANLVLIIERSIPDQLAWMAEYLEEDRDIGLVWDGNNELFASDQTREGLSFLWND